MAGRRAQLPIRKARRPTTKSSCGTDYQSAVEANKKSPGAISQVELKRKLILLILAETKLQSLAE
jgi:hypothetical protein